ncbi:MULTISPECIES: class I SAM-dependent methyltransferase [Salinibaculum]|uniref:class I SAM-dependent methyltransferase n=1 Tax=Salinibaculum TaxID=2732368 RepID=UPI0030CB7672
MDSDSIYNRHLDVFLLWACRETGVVDALLAGPKTPEELAAASEIRAAAAEPVLDGLVDLGYAEVSGEAYAPAEELQAFDPDTPALERGILPHRLDSLETYLSLPEILRSGDLPEATEEGFLNYMGAMATVDEQLVREAVTVAEHAHPRPDRVLDVGGGSGGFGAEFVRRGADATLVDLPEVLDLLADHHADLGLETVPGDARESLPEGFDLVFSARVTVNFTPAQLRAYYENAFAALDPGGTVVSTTRIRGRSPEAARFGVHMLTLPADGTTLTEETYLSALDETGFVDAEIREVPDTQFQAVVAHRPE